MWPTKPLTRGTVILAELDTYIYRSRSTACNIDLFLPTWHAAYIFFTRHERRYNYYRTIYDDIRYDNSDV